MCKKLVNVLPVVWMLCVSALAYADWSDDFSEDPPVLVASGRNSAALNQDSAAGIYTVENAANTPAFGWDPEGYIAMVNSNNNPRGFGYLVDVGSGPGQIEPGTYEFSANMTWEADSHATLVDVYVLSGNWAVGFRGGPAESSEEGIRSVIARTDEAALAMKVGSVFLPDGTASTEESPVDITIPDIVATEGSKVLMFCYFIAVGADGLRVNSMALNSAGPKTQARAPLPINGSTDVVHDVELTWKPGDSAVSRDVYFGTVLDDVNEASVDDPRGILVSQGQTDASYTAGRLDFGQTYYWRVDEVNGTPDKTVFKGDVWSFEVEPYSILIPGSSIAVTASSSTEISPAEKTIDGSGIDPNSSHSVNNEDMWYSASGDLDPWIEYEFESVEKLDRMNVWNANSTSEKVIGWGVKDVQIEYSADGENWDTLQDANQFSRAPGSSDYDQYDEIKFNGVVAKSVRLNIQSSWGGLVPQYSLSEVQFYMIPVKARTPEPASGAVDVLPDVMASWRAGREAAEHTIYVGTDPNEVADGLAPSVTTSTDSLDLASLNLQLGQTYYWRVDEVNEAEAAPLWAGPVWSFTTVPNLTVDNFDGYGNISPDRPFQTWLDGFGYSADEFFPVAYGGNGTGSGVGHDVWSFNSPHYEGDIMEGTIARSGKSMPVYFDNTGGSSLSETQRTLEPAQDWTRHGVKGLVLWFAGDPANTGAGLYVKINNTKLAYDGPADSLMLPAWQMWYIDLQTPGAANLTNVTQLTIGLSSGQGIIYIDDILLSPHERHLITPTAPDAAGLALAYDFEDNFTDSSGNARDGIGENTPEFEAGPSGRVVTLDGFNYVVVPGYQGFAADRTDPNNPVQVPFTLALWVKTTENGDVLSWGSSDETPIGGQYMTLRVAANTLRATHGNGNLQGTTTLTDGQWHHVAVTAMSGANLRVPQTVLYVDGMADGTAGGADTLFNITAEADVNIGRRASHEDRTFAGSLDELRIYDYALSAEEVAWLAGRTQPFDRP